MNLPSWEAVGLQERILQVDPWESSSACPLGFSWALVSFLQSSLPCLAVQVTENDYLLDLIQILQGLTLPGLGPTGPINSRQRVGPCSRAKELPLTFEGREEPYFGIKPAWVIPEDESHGSQLSEVMAQMKRCRRTQTHSDSKWLSGLKWNPDPGFWFSPYLNVFH